MKLKLLIVVGIIGLLVFSITIFSIDNYIQNKNPKTIFIDSSPFIKVSEGVNYNLQTGEIVLYNENKTITIK